MDNLLSGTECRTRNRALGHAVRCAAIMLLCVLSLCACDPYSGCRPYDYGDAKWVCEEYGAWFTVKEEENYQCYGEVVVDGKVQKIAILFAPGSFVVILPRDAVENMSPIETDNELWNGEANPERTLQSRGRYCCRENNAAPSYCVPPEKMDGSLYAARFAVMTRSTIHRL